MSKRNLYAFIISFAFLVTVIILNRISFDKMRTYSGWVDHTRDVITTLESLSNNFKSAQVYTPTHDTGALKGFYGLYKSDAEHISGELYYLKKIVGDNRDQSELVNKISDSMTAQMPELMQKNTTELIESGTTATLQSLLHIH